MIRKVCLQCRLKRSILESRCTCDIFKTPSLLLFMLLNGDSCNSFWFSAIWGKNLDEEEDDPNEKLIWLFIALDELPFFMLAKPEFHIKTNPVLIISLKHVRKLNLQWHTMNHNMLGLKII